MFQISNPAGAVFGDGLPRMNPDPVLSQFADSRRIPAPDADAHGDMLARSYGHDDMPFWPRNNPIGAPPESNRKGISQNLNVQVTEIALESKL